MKNFIHINMHHIRANLKNGTNLPVITVKHGKYGKINEYGHEAEIMGPCKVIYGGNDKPLLPCGARVVIETESEVKVYDKSKRKGKNTACNVPKCGQGK